MKKDSFMKDALVLTAITLISGLLLGVVYGMTKDTIANAIKEATNKAYKVVLDAADYDSEELKDTFYRNFFPGNLTGDGRSWTKSNSSRVLRAVCRKNHKDCREKRRRCRRE